MGVYCISRFCQQEDRKKYSPKTFSNSARGDIVFLFRCSFPEKQPRSKFQVKRHCPVQCYGVLHLINPTRLRLTSGCVCYHSSRLTLERDVSCWKFGSEEGPFLGITFMGSELSNQTTFSRCGLISA